MADRSVRVTFSAIVDGFVAGVQQAAAATDSLRENITGSVESGKEAFDTLGTAALGAGLVVGGFVATAVSKFADFDQAMSAAQAATSATGAELDGLRQLAIKMGADTQFSATDAANAITEMGKAGVSTADIYGGGLKGALDLAAAGQLDVGRAGEIAATALNQFGLTGKDTTHVADLLAAGAGKAQGSVEDLASALNYVGPVAKSMGISIDETVGVLAEFASKGIIGEQAGTSLRGVLLSLTAPSALAKKAIDLYGIAVYDSGGKVNSLAALSQSLHTQLGGLDEATRNAALGQIFGNAQITAAIALYEGGGKAVTDWTGKVNDAGYAADQAAALTNNLKGDVERLGGSLDTVFIQAGSSANDSLRSLVKNINDAVNSFSSLPAPLQKDAFQLAAVSAGVLIVGGGLLVAIPRIVAFRAALETLATSSGRVGASLSTLGKAVGVIGVAAAAVEVNKFVAAANVADPSTKQLAAGLLDVANNAKESSDFGTIFASGAGVFRKSIDTTSDAVKDFGANAKAALDPTSYETFFGTAATASGVFQERVQQIDTALVALVKGGHADEAAAVVDKLSQSTVQFGGSADKVRASFTGYQSALATVAPTADAAGSSTSALGDTLATTADTATALADALDAAKQAVKSYGDVVAGARDANRAYQASIDDAASSLDTQRNALADARLKMLGIKDATDQQRNSALLFADAQIKAGAGLDINTAAGRANQAALDGIAKAALDATVQNYTNGSSIKSVTQALVGKGGARDSFIETAVRMGSTRGAAGALADQLGLTTVNVQQLTQSADKIKPEYKAKITADTASANAAVEGSRRKLDALDGASATVTVRAVDLASRYISNVRNALASLHDRTLTVTTIAQEKNIAAHGGVTGQATGGAVYGPGTGTSDSVPRMLSTGEHVWTAREVSAAGGQSSMYAARQRVLTGGPIGMAAGGAVTAANSSVNVRALVPVSSFTAPNTGPRGPLVTTGDIYAVDATAAALALERRFSDSLAAAGINRGVAVG